MPFYEGQALELLQFIFGPEGETSCHATTKYMGRPLEMLCPGGETMGGGKSGDPNTKPGDVHPSPDRREALVEARMLLNHCAVLNHRSMKDSQVQCTSTHIRRADQWLILWKDTPKVCETSIMALELIVNMSDWNHTAHPRNPNADLLGAGATGAGGSPAGAAAMTLKRGHTTATEALGQLISNKLAAQITAQVPGAQVNLADPSAPATVCIQQLVRSAVITGFDPGQSTILDCYVESPLNQATAATIGTMLRNRAKWDRKVRNHVDRLLRLAPRLETNKPAMRCICSCIALGFIYKCTDEPGATGQLGDAVKHLLQELDPQNPNGGANAMCALYTLTALGKDFHELKMGDRKREVKTVLENQAALVVGTCEKLMQECCGPIAQASTARLNPPGAPAGSTTSSPGGPLSAGSVGSETGLGQPPVPEAATLIEPRQVLLAELLLEAAVPWVELCPAKAVATVSLQGLICGSKAFGVFGVASQAQSAGKGAKGGSGGSSGSSFLEALVEKTVQLPLEDPLFHPFVNALLQHVSLPPDAHLQQQLAAAKSSAEGGNGAPVNQWMLQEAADQDNFLRMRLLLTALDSWKRDRSVMETIVNQIIDGNGLRCRKTCGLAIGYIANVKR